MAAASNCMTRRQKTPGARGAWVRLRFAAGEVNDSASPETPITKAASGH